jgi:hypothetical protein
MKTGLLALALPVVLLTGCASGGYYGYDGGPGYYPGYYGGDYYAGGPVVDVGVYGSGHGGYYHHDERHYDSNYRTAVASRGSTSSFHASGTRVASASHYSGHAGSSHTASASVSAGHDRH